MIMSCAVLRTMRLNMVRRAWHQGTGAAAFLELALAVAYPFGWGTPGEGNLDPGAWVVPILG